MSKKKKILIFLVSIFVFSTLLTNNIFSNNVEAADTENVYYRGTEWPNEYASDRAATIGGDDGYWAQNKAVYPFMGGEAISTGNAMDLRVGAPGANEATVKVYCFNYHKTAPVWKKQQNQYTVGYQKYTNANAEKFIELADTPRSVETLRQDILNVVWNGFPYFAGDWNKKSVDEIQEYLSYYSIPDEEKENLWAMEKTQNAIWYYTDNTDSFDPDVQALLESARNNPAPPNFQLDLYDSTNAWAMDDYGSEIKDFQNLLGVSLEELPDIEITITKSWLDTNDSVYNGEKPHVVFELYDGDISEGESPLQSIELNGQTEVTFSMLKDNQQYTLREIVSDNTLGFTSASDQSFIADDNQTVSFTNKQEVQSTSFDLSISKTVSGELGDLTKKFAFDIILEMPIERGFIAVNGNISGIYTANDSTSIEKEITFTNGKATVELSHGESVVIEDLLEGSKYEVIEKNGEGYFTTYNGQKINSFKGTLDADQQIQVENNRESVPPTGLLDSTGHGVLVSTGITLLFLITILLYHSKIWKRKK